MTHPGRAWCPTGFNRPHACGHQEEERDEKRDLVGAGGRDGCHGRCAGGGGRRPCQPGTWVTLQTGHMGNTRIGS